MVMKVVTGVEQVVLALVEVGLVGLPELRVLLFHVALEH